MDRYYGFLVQNGDPIELDENNKDPIIYMDAMQRPDFEKWLEAMKFEMESRRSTMYGHWLTHLKGLNPLGVNESSKGRGAQTER